MSRLKNNKAVTEQPNRKHRSKNPASDFSKSDSNESSPSEIDVRNAGSLEQHAALLGDTSSGKLSDTLRRAMVVRQLQSNFGNRYVSRLLDHVSRRNSTVIQAKLTVGPAGDKYEREADHVAKQVLGQIKGAGEQPVQSQGTEGEDPSLVQLKPLQRQIGIEGGDVSGDVESSIDGSRSSGTSIEKNVRRSMENAFGADFSDVKVHNGAESTALNDSMGARAFTTGNDIFFRQGEYNPGSDAGKEILAHELTHVVQQTSPPSVNRSPQIVQRDDEPTAPSAGSTPAPETASEPSQGDEDQVLSDIDKVKAGLAASDLVLATASFTTDVTERLALLDKAKELAADAAAAAAVIGGAAGVIQAVSGLVNFAQAGAEIYETGAEEGKLDLLDAAASTALGTISAGFVILTAEIGAAAETSGFGLAVAPATIASGGVHILMGSYDIFKGVSEHSAVDTAISGADATPGMEEAIHAANIASEGGKNRAMDGGMTVATGILEVAGGIMLLAGVANPVGAAILGAAGAVALTSYFFKALHKRSEGKKVVAKETEKFETDHLTWVNTEDKSGLTEPTLDPLYDVENWHFGDKQWRRGYSYIFSEHKKKEAKVAAKGLYDKIIEGGPQTQANGPTLPGRAIAIQVVRAMGIKVDHYALEEGIERPGLLSDIEKHLETAAGYKW
jgi:hypothetical protein